MNDNLVCDAAEFVLFSQLMNGKIAHNIYLIYIEHCC